MGQSLEYLVTADLYTYGPYSGSLSKSLAAGSTIEIYCEKIPASYLCRNLYKSFILSRFTFGSIL